MYHLFNEVMVANFFGFSCAGIYSFQCKIQKTYFKLSKW